LCREIYFSIEIKNWDFSKHDFSLKFSNFSPLILHTFFHSYFSSYSLMIFCGYKKLRIFTYFLRNFLIKYTLNISLIINSNTFGNFRCSLWFLKCFKLVQKIFLLNIYAIFLSREGFHSITLRFLWPTVASEKGKLKMSAEKIVKVSYVPYSFVVGKILKYYRAYAIDIVLVWAWEGMKKLSREHEREYHLFSLCLMLHVRFCPHIVKWIDIESDAFERVYLFYNNNHHESLASLIISAWRADNF
jgi:hypothetical protein